MELSFIASSIFASSCVASTCMLLAFASFSSRYPLIVIILGCAMDRHCPGVRLVQGANMRLCLSSPSCRTCFLLKVCSGWTSLWRLFQFQTCCHSIQGCCKARFVFRSREGLDPRWLQRKSEKVALVESRTNSWILEWSGMCSATICQKVVSAWLMCILSLDLLFNLERSCDLWQTVELNYV